MNNPEKLATWGTQDEQKQNKNTALYHYTLANTNNVNKTNNWRQRRTEHRFMRESQQISQHGTQNVKTHKRTTPKTKKMSNTDPPTNPGGELRCSRRVSSFCFL